MTWFLDLRADSVGGNPAREVIVRQDANYCFDIGKLIEEARGKDVLFGTHGFNRVVPGVKLMIIGYF